MHGPTWRWHLLFHSQCYPKRCTPLQSLPHTHKAPCTNAHLRPFAMPPEGMHATKQRVPHSQGGSAPTFLLQPLPCLLRSCPKQCTPQQSVSHAHKAPVTSTHLPPGAPPLPQRPCCWAGGPCACQACLPACASFAGCTTWCQASSTEQQGTLSIEGRHATQK